MGLIMNTVAAAADQRQPGYAQSFDALRNVAYLGESLRAVHTYSGAAIKKSRDCGLPKLEAELIRIQAELEGLIARLRPAVFYGAVREAGEENMHPLIRFVVSENDSRVLVESCHGNGAIELEAREIALLTEGLQKIGQTGPEPETVCLDPVS